MTRSQLRTAVRYEAVIVALFGTLLGLVIGLFFGWALVQALKSNGIDRLTVPLDRSPRWSSSRAGRRHRGGMARTTRLAPRRPEGDRDRMIGARRGWHTGGD